MFSRKKQAQQDLVTRYEAKYIIPREKVPGIRAFIAPFCTLDPYAREGSLEYSITTLQLDAPDYALHLAKEREMLKRFKLRARTYGEIGSAPVFAEVKAKLDKTIVKTRVHIPFALWSKDLVLGTALPNCFRNRQQELDFLNFKRLVWDIGALPVVLIRYQRESYVGTVDRYARVTFDSQLQYQMTDSWTDFGKSGVWRAMDSTEAQGFGLPYSGLILEVKTLSYVPVWALDMIETFELCKYGNCKYSTALWREGLFTGYPPVGRETEEALALI